jgi:hypothetical protein
MSKKVVEPMLYTAQELDVIRSIIADEVGPLGYPLADTWKRMVILGGNLYTFLLHEGFTCTYKPARKQCTQTIKVLLSDEYTCTISLCTSSIWVTVGLYFPVRIESIGQLVTYLHTLPTQCPSCYYCNGAAPLYCGMGADMVKGCGQYVPRDSVIKR